MKSVIQTKTNSHGRHPYDEAPDSHSTGIHPFQSRSSLKMMGGSTHLNDFLTIINTNRLRIGVITSSSSLIESKSDLHVRGMQIWAFEDSPRRGGDTLLKIQSQPTGDQSSNPHKTGSAFLEFLHRPTFHLILPNGPRLLL